MDVSNEIGKELEKMADEARNPKQELVVRVSREGTSSFVEYRCVSAEMLLDQGVTSHIICAADDDHPGVTTVRKRRPNGTTPMPGVNGACHFLMTVDGYQGKWVRWRMQCVDGFEAALTTVEMMVQQADDAVKRLYFAAGELAKAVKLANTHAVVLPTPEAQGTPEAIGGFTMVDKHGVPINPAPRTRRSAPTSPKAGS